MRALVTTKAGGPEVLQVQQRPDPEPRQGELLVRVKRAGLNFSDIAARVGLYPDAPAFPTVMGYEVSGVVTGLGAATQGFTVGDRVAGMVRFGGQAELVAVPAAQMRKVPDGMSFEHAAALPVNALTAFHLLFWVAPIRPGMTVLVHMAAGGVGLMAAQLCRTVENVTVIGTASASKHEYLRAHGVHHCIDYRTGDYATEVRALTEGRGVDRILDALGGADWSKGYSLLRPGGHLCCFGWANMVQSQKRNLLHVAKELLALKRWSPMTLMTDNKGLSGTNMGHLWGEMDRLGRTLDTIFELHQRGTLEVRVDKVFTLEQAAEAHAHIQGRQNVGKVLFTCE